MPQISLAITTDSDDIDSATTLEARLREALDTADEELVDAISLHTGDQHEEWEEDGCPECGNKQLSVMEPREHLYHIEDGEWEYSGHGDVTGTQLGVFCIECSTHITEHPAEHILTYY